MLSIFFVLSIINEFDLVMIRKYIYNYFDKFKVNYTIFYDLTLFFHVVKLKRMKVQLNESFILLLMKIFRFF